MNLYIRDIKKIKMNKIYISYFEFTIKIIKLRLTHIQFFNFILFTLKINLNEFFNKKNYISC